MNPHLAQPLLENDVPVSEAIVAALADAGVEHVLGIPGGLTGPIWRALYDHPTIRTLLVREESLGSYMAEAYGRLRGAPAVVMGQGEWIVGNAGQGYLESLLGSSPMVILTEMTDGGPLSHHAVYQGGSGDYGAWNTSKALEGVTKRVMVSRHPAQAVQHVQLAIKHSLTGEPGPVAVVFASTALQGEVGPESVPRLFRFSGYIQGEVPAPPPSQVDAVAATLTSSARPVIVAGNGVRVAQACRALLEVAVGFDVPVVTTAHGKGVIDESHPLAGGVIGAFGWPSANDLLADADVILAIGTKLGTTDTIDETTALIDPKRQVLMQVDIEPLNVGWTMPVAYHVTADAEAFLRSLGESTTSTPGTSRSSTAATRVADAFNADTTEVSAEWPDALPFRAQRVVELLNDCLPEEAIVTCDAGENRLFMMRWFRSRRPAGYLQPAAGGGMGHAVPAALGAKLAHPDAPVVAVCGDGGFGMSLHGLLTAIEQELPIGVIVLNNGALGWVLHGMGEQAVASTFADFDYAAIASAIGCDAVRARRSEDLTDALARLPDSKVPVVIEVPISLETSFRDILDPLAERRRSAGY